MTCAVANGKLTETFGPAQKDVTNTANHQRNDHLDQKPNAFEPAEDGINFPSFLRNLVFYHIFYKIFIPFKTGLEFKSQYSTV